MAKNPMGGFWSRLTPRERTYILVLILVFFGMGTLVLLYMRDKALRETENDIADTRRALDMVYTRGAVYKERLEEKKEREAKISDKTLLFSTLLEEAATVSESIKWSNEEELPALDLGGGLIKRSFKFNLRSVSLEDLVKFLAKREASQRQRAAASETSAALESYFSGVTVVQAHVAEDRIGDAMGAQLNERAVHELRLAKLWVAFSIFFQATNVVGQLVIVLVGGLRVLDGSLGLGTFFAFYHYLGLLLGPMMDLPNLLVTSRQAFVCMERLDELDEFDREGEGGAPVEAAEERDDARETEANGGQMAAHGASSSTSSTMKT